MATVEECVDEIVTYLVIILQKTPLGAKSIDMTVVRNKVLPIIETVMKKLDNQNGELIIKFIKNQSLLNTCILPNVAQILQDGKITVMDAPQFLSIMVGIFENVQEFISENPTITITSNDIIELSSLIVKVILNILVNDQDMLLLSNSLIDSSIKLVKIVIKPKSFSCKLLCCKK